MASNKYFNLYNQKQEQNLIQDLIEESIKIHAIDALYIPRDIQNLDPIFKEDPVSSFSDYHHIEVYIKSYDGFSGDGSILSKFGLEIKDQITFTVSRSSYAKILGTELSRPREGDLIYLQMSTATALYEIKFVNEHSTFFNLGEFYTYDLQCEKYTFQDENISTGIDNVDNNIATGSEVYVLDIENPTGDFTEGEFIYQGDTLLSATSRAKFIEYVTSTQIKIKDLYSEFEVSKGLIKGAISNSQATLSSNIDTSDIRDDFASSNDDFNDFVIIDFTESNPFSEE